MRNFLSRIAGYVYFPLGYFPKEMRYWASESLVDSKEKNETL